eukprot:Nk52_evm4s2449 gene=Nk52_evmTU4s2449
MSFSLLRRVRYSSPACARFLPIPTPAHPTRCNSSTLTHVDKEGRARMVDVAGKSPTTRTAVAEARIRVGAEIGALLRAGGVNHKGDVLNVAQLAGIMGGKMTSQLIPLCHNIPISKLHVDVELARQTEGEGGDPGLVLVRAMAKTVGVTGIEMEALTAVSVAALTVYDMCKAASHEITIETIRLVEKTGGKSDYKFTGGQ